MNRPHARPPASDRDRLAHPALRDSNPDRTLVLAARRRPRLGIAWGDQRPITVGIIAVSIIISVVVHELGHGLTARACGLRPMIVLHGLGGATLTGEEVGTLGKRLLIAVMGPVASLLLAVLSVVAWATVSTSVTEVGSAAELAFSRMLIINILYGIFSLIPIWPLDGGRLMLALLDHLSPQNGQRRGHIVMFLMAASAAVLVASYSDAVGSLALVVLLGYFAVLNFVLLSHYHRLAMADRETS